MVKVNDFVWQAPAGPIRGWQADGVYYATGIAYGKADRFAYPQPLEPTVNEIQAYQAGYSCYQKADQHFADYRLPMHYQEAPLTLSITVPQNVSPTNPLPVMVWIHGGYYTFGSADSRLYQADLIVKEQDVIVVAINYRLAVFGYSIGENQQPANLGLLDQVLALQWIQQNIAAFGGDPHQVTLFGQSAGADAVTHLMLVEGADTLFQRAIIQSAPLGNMKHRQRLNQYLLAKLIEFGTERPAQDLVDFQLTTEAYSIGRFGLAATMPFGLKYGVYPLPFEADLASTWAKVAPKFEVLIGYNTNECAGFAADIPSIGSLWLKPWGRRLLQPALSILNWLIFERPVKRFVKTYQQAGGWIGRYAITWGAPESPSHSGHCVELPLLFGYKYYMNSSMVAQLPEKAFTEHGPSLRRIWANFAREGNLTQQDQTSFFKLWID